MNAEEMIGREDLIINRDGLGQLVRDWLAKDKPLAAPKRIKDDLVQYALCTDFDEIMLDGFVHPDNSIKTFLFPRHEKLYHYETDELGRITLEDSNFGEFSQLLLGVRPCDAAIVPILNHVFNWDLKDSFYNRRAEGTVIIALGCTTCDANCFCTSVGGAPDGVAGADALLFPTSDPSVFAVKVVSEKGAHLLAKYCAIGTAAPKAAAEVPVRFDMDTVHDWLKENFESPFWEEESLSCVGCGACSYTCPTCHCFDIMDEKNGLGAGWRVRNWDYCQGRQFTLHASGHNPRATQGARQRQRLTHKFWAYRDRFGTVLCTGCGNCIRRCPVGLGVLPFAKKICELAKKS
ncbi:hypothetical protein GX645_03985 [Candidatus Sumerlaeota bacterium]|nr:4Fe-4S dicluster domain-containing protein [Candidatus Sumerlaeales bacterium]NLD61592.1 hypothetical protein [Candidatus Sumerlaeota bacterium]